MISLLLISLIAIALLTPFEFNQRAIMLKRLNPKLSKKDIDIILNSDKML